MHIALRARIDYHKLAIIDEISIRQRKTICYRMNLSWPCHRNSGHVFPPPVKTSSYIVALRSSRYCFFDFFMLQWSCGLEKIFRPVSNIRKAPVRSAFGLVGSLSGNHQDAIEFREGL